MGRIDEDFHVGGHLTCRTFTAPANSMPKTAVPANAGYEYSKLEQLHQLTYAQAGRPARHRIRSVWFDLDNGAGTTIDDVLLRPTAAITVVAARILYVDATSGTVAAGNVRIGTALAGAGVVAATAYEDAKAVGTKTELVIAAGAVAADTPLIVRHTGVAATAAGQACVEVEYTEDAAANREVFDVTVPLHIAFGGTGDVISVEAMLQEGLPGGTREHTVDLQYGTPSSGYATILTAPIEFTSASVLRTVVEGTVSADDFVEGGSFRLVIASSGTGANGRGLAVTVRLAEDALEAA